MLEEDPEVFLVAESLLGFSVELLRIAYAASTLA